ncbi:helix-turn-helix transcriptional regulator [Thalassobaculum sp.]|uniref:helix-turn-helix transcriptional regulator n=1 Tax=Thalassobaculum sp. TaxID=2022740 RepID=UPI003B595DB4
MTNTRFIRFADLVERGIVSNRQTLGRWIRHHGFPRGVRLGPNTTAWVESDVDDWLEGRTASHSDTAAA